MDEHSIYVEPERMILKYDENGNLVRVPASGGTATIIEPANRPIDIYEKEQIDG